MRGEERPSDAVTLSLAATSDEAPPAEPAGVTLGETVGRYQVRRLLGKGGMGQVYLARDVVLGRSVALKIVGPSKTGAFSTERFLHEARAIARLNHPHVVQLYDFGEYKGGLYLALEYVEGDTLRERARAGTLGMDEILRLARAIADGLSHAHAAGVFHCDLKPSNVMVGKDGRVRVVDFGIARTGDNAATSQAGTPDWMAPEQWSGAPLTDRVDSWALGIVVSQLITGSHPLGDDSDLRRDPAHCLERVAALRIDHCSARPDVPASVLDLIQRALELEPTLRPSTAEWARVLDGVILEGRGDAVIEDGPFRGLAAFDERHARYYFGREREIDAFLERLREAPQLPIVGPSGAGKSSFLHAGVIPRLRAREPWTVIAFRPGGDPIGALARQVMAAIRDDRRPEPRPSEVQHKAQVHAFRAELRETPTLLAARLATIASMHQSRVLLAVDQLEEAFTQGAPEAERQQFLDMLLAAADDPLDPVRVVVTVRDDFVGKLAGLRSLFVMKKLEVDDLRRTITGPLARHDYELDEPAIVDDLIAEVGAAEAGNLPLLQFACRTLWDGRDTQRRKLLRATYREMGGVAGALARHADQALAELSPAELSTARQLLLRLVVGTTRRSVPRDQLVRGDSDAGVLDRLLAARLVVQRHPDDGGPPLIEIAHESLVHTWSQLARWLDESREERRLLEELQDAAALWQRRGKRSDETWPEAELATARHRAAQLGLALPPAVEEFFTTGDQRHRAARRQKRLRFGIALAIVITFATGVFLVIARYVAREQLIENNMGTVDFEVSAFDWQGGVAVPVSIYLLTELRVTVYLAKLDNIYEPGEPVPADQFKIEHTARAGLLDVFRIRAPGGTVFLRFDGRGRADERCPSSWIRIQSFPGYRTRDIERLPLRIPTCQVTRANLVRIEAGPFYYGGPGDPPSRHYGEPDYTEPERIVDLKAFAMDRTEVSNAAYAPFHALASITGYRGPTYTPAGVHAHDTEPDLPVSDINAFEARAYCAYLGKRLPSELEWTKAARGGISVHGAPNPMPKRLYPWGNVAHPECISSMTDTVWLRPVDSLPCGASPYGILHLVGNIDEWISREGQTDRDNPLYALRGGRTDAPESLETTTTIYRNHREPNQADYGIGVRCVVGMEELP